MNNTEIEKKIDFLINRFNQYSHSKPELKNLIKEAILFGQQHMKQKAIACVPEAVEYGPYARDERDAVNNFRAETLKAIEEL